MTNHGLKSYSLFKKGGALTEVVCSILAIFLLFTSWIWIESDTGIKESSPSVVSLLNKTGGPAVWFIFGVLLVNILLKYFKRSAWMSAICAFAFGVLVFQNVQSISVDFEMLGTHVTLSLWGYLAIFIEVIFVVSTLIGLFESLMNLKNFNRKTAKNYFLVALVGFIIIILSFFLMSKDVELAPVLFVVGQVLLIVFVLLGLVIRFFGKKEDRIAIIDDETVVNQRITPDDEPVIKSSIEQGIKDDSSNYDSQKSEYTLSASPVPNQRRNQIIPHIIGGVIVGLLMATAGYYMYQKFSQKGEDVEVVMDDENYDAEGGDMTTELYGSVANYLITMQLYFDGNTVDGSYYYDRKGPGETLSLNGTYKDGKLDLYETDPSGRQTGHFDGYYDGVEYKGIFINRDGKRMSFILNDNPPASKPVTTTSPAPSTDPDAQYVKVTGVNVRLRTTPSINDNNIIKDAWGKNVHPYKGEKLKMVSEEDEFYLVIYRGDYVYISKQFAVLE